MKYADIIAKVKAYMDEVGAIDGALLIDIDTEKPIDMLIAETLASGWRSFVLQCPLHLLPVTTFGTAIAAIAKVGFITIPENFIKVAVIKMTSWGHDLNDVYPTTGPGANLYAMQANEFTRGTPTRPIAFIKSGTIECYSGAAATEEVTFKYVADVLFDAVSTEEIVAANIAHAFCYHVAGNVYDILGNQVAKTMYANRDALCV